MAAELPRSLIQHPALYGRLPELTCQCLGEHALEVRNAGELAIQVRRGDAVEHVVDDRTGVPASEQDPHGAPGRQRAPEAPVGRSVALLVRLLPVRGRYLATSLFFLGNIKESGNTFREAIDLNGLSL